MSNRICCCCCCCESKIQQKCSKHNLLLQYFCTNKKCLEILCEKCLPQHNTVHKQLGYMPFIPTDLHDVERRMENVIRKESLQAKEAASVTLDSKKLIIPENIICEELNNYLYASFQQAENVLATQYSAQSFLKIVEQANQYVPRSGFKERYYAFLDQCIREHLKP